MNTLTPQCCKPFDLNSGNPLCRFIPKEALKVLYMFKYADDGSENGIDIRAVEDSDLLTVLTAMVNDPDPSKRLYPDLEAFAFEREREDKEFEDLSPNIKAPLRQGELTLQYHIHQTASQRNEFYEKLNCKEIMFFVIDVEGNLVGQFGDYFNSENFAANTEQFDLLKGFPIMRNTLYSRDVPANDDSVQKIQVNLTVDRLTFKDGYAAMIKGNHNVTKIEGLVGLTGLVIAVANDTLIGGFKSMFDGAALFSYIKTFTASDFAIENLTQSQTESFSVVFDGEKYVFTLNTPVTDGDKLEITLSATGFAETKFITTFENNS